MAKEAVLDRVSFAAGEISPALRARTDLARHATAVRFLENMVVLVEGGATRRPGTQFVIALKDVTQRGLLIPFRFSTSDVLMLVFNAGVMRVIANGGVVLSAGVPFELAIPYAAADLPNIRFAQSGNLIFLACTGKQPQVLTRGASDTAWTIAPYLSTGGPVDVQNLTQTVTIKVDALTGAINLTGTNTTWDAGLIGGVFKLYAASVADVTIWSASEAVGAAGLRQFNGNVYQNMGYAGGGTTNGVVPPTHTDGDVAYPSSAANTTITWRFLNPGYGFVRITGFTDATHMAGVLVVPTGSTTWQLPTDLTTTATFRWSPPIWSPDAGWPDRVMLYQNALMWGRGNKAWQTTTNNFFDFDLTAPGGATALAFAMTADDGALINIEWLAQQGVVLVGGHDGEFVVRGANTFDTLTAANIRVVPDRNEGSCPHIPARVEGGTMFIGRDRQRLHHVTFSPLTAKLDIKEVTVTARHILAGKAARVAWQRDPGHVAWIIGQDGSLVSLTYMVEQGVVGWARHPLANGFVEDIAAIQSVDDTVTQIYLIVRRVIAGVTQRYVEMLTPFYDLSTLHADASGAWYLDCAAQYVGMPATTIGGLSYLQGETVYAHADGAMQGPFTVSVGGQITLSRAASNVIVGKAIAWRLRTLSFDMQTQGGTTKGVKKEANQVNLDLLNCAGGTIAVNPDQYQQWDDMELTGAIAYGGPVPLFTGLQRISVQSAADAECVVELKAADTMPFTILGITPYMIIEEPS